MLAGLLILSVAIYLIWGSSTPTQPPSASANSSPAASPQHSTSIYMNASSLPVLPAPSFPWFTASVNYSGSWEANAVVFNGASQIFTVCYVGTGQGYFLVQNSSFPSSATIQITATKLDGGVSTLSVAVNGNISSTSALYGSTAVSASVEH